MIQEIKEDYRAKRIDSKEYAIKMFNVYKILIEHVNLLKGSMVKKIEISQENVVIKIKGHSRDIKMVLHPVDVAAVPATVMSFGEYELTEINMTLKLLKELEEESIVFDIGANLGWYTLNILADNSRRKVYSFEPIQETFDKLKKNLEINEFEVENIYNIGFYKSNKEMDFFYDTTASGASSLVDLRELNTTKKVKCIFKKMDDFINENKIKRLDFIKCDVEGSELFVYEGGLKSIEKFKPIIFSEILRKWSAKFNYHPNHIIELLKTIGYKCFVIEGDMLKEFYYVDEQTVQTNYFFLHEEKHKSIISKLISI